MNINMKANHVRRWRLLVATAIALFTLNLVAPSRMYAEENGRFVVVPVKNPQYCGNELFRAFENYYSPRFRKLHSRYKLADVVAGESDEWKRILLLRHWIRSNSRRLVCGIGSSKMKLSAAVCRKDYLASKRRLVA